jgi:hypothetical protein
MAAKDRRSYGPGTHFPSPRQTHEVGTCTTKPFPSPLIRLKTLEQTLEKHLKVRDGCDTPEPLRIRYQIDFLKKLLGLE